MSNKFLFIFFALLLLTLTGCAKKERNDYVRYAHRQQQHQKEAYPPTSRLDEPVAEKQFINLSSNENTAWKRLPWETIDQWIERIQKQLVLNHEIILRLREQVDALEQNESALADDMQLVIARNEEMRSLISELEPIDSPATKDIERYASLPPPPFRVHLVQKGETLYSIARSYYGNPHMTDNIILWNQGWIRNPHHLVAGLALVLFTEDSAKKNEQNEQVVDNYVSQLIHYK